MAEDFPNDSDGDALRMVASSGADFGRPMSIDFQVAFPDQAGATAFAEAAAELGYRVGLYDEPEEGEPWTCECSTRMLATYDGVVAIQRELAELSRPFKGYPDGWGTFGNA